jgi:hypothetical protein
MKLSLEMHLPQYFINNKGARNKPMLTYKEREEKKNLLDTILLYEDLVGPSHHLVQSILFVIHPCIRKPLSDRRAEWKIF